MNPGKIKIGGNNRIYEFWANTYLSQFTYFEDFVTEISQDLKFSKVVLSQTHFRPQYHWICFPNKQKPLTDYIGRFENLKSDISFVAEVLNIKIELPHLKNLTNNYKLSDIYSSKMIAVVENLYEQDLVLFDYGFE